MNGNAVDQAIAAARLPDGYTFERLQRQDVTEVIRCVRRWYPDIAVGTASCLLRPAFYGERVAFEPDDSGDVFVVTIRCQRQMAGVVVVEREPDALTLYGRVVVVAPGHRGARLGRHAIVLVEAIGRALGMGIVYGLATLKIPHVQQAFEQLGWELIGIAPGLDREFVAGGDIKRVYEAIYARTLAAAGDLHLPRMENMTPKVRELFDRLFARTALAVAA